MNLNVIKCFLLNELIIEYVVMILYILLNSFQQNIIFLNFIFDIFLNVPNN